MILKKFKISNVWCKGLVFSTSCAVCGGDKGKHIVSFVKRKKEIEIKLIEELCFLYNAEKLMAKKSLLDNKRQKDC